MPFWDRSILWFESMPDLPSSLGHFIDLTQPKGRIQRLRLSTFQTLTQLNCVKDELVWNKRLPVCHQLRCPSTWTAEAAKPASGGHGAVHLWKVYINGIKEEHLKSRGERKELMNPKKWSFRVITSCQDKKNLQQQSSLLYASAPWGWEG